MDLQKKNGQPEKTIGSLAAVNGYCHRAGWCFSSVSGSPLLFFSYRLLLGDAFFSIGSLEAVTVAAPWITDSAQYLNKQNLKTQKSYFEGFPLINIRRFPHIESVLQTCFRLCYVM